MMIAVDEREKTDYFENLEVPEGFKAELLRGDIVMMAGPDRVHNMIVQAVQDQVPRDRWHRLHTQDIDIPGETSQPQPDLVVVERGAFEGQGRLIPAPAVSLVLEVVSKNSADRDYKLKRSMYAAGSVPAYLIVDPFTARCALLTEPTGEGDAIDYAVERISKFGEPVPVDVLGVTLATDEFQTMV
jgi:Uma2 family endonuclease